MAGFLAAYGGRKVFVSSRSNDTVQLKHCSNSESRQLEIEEVLQNPENREYVGFRQHVSFQESSTGSFFSRNE